MVSVVFSYITFTWSIVVVFLSEMVQISLLDRMELQYSAGCKDFVEIGWCIVHLAVSCTRR